MTNRRKRLFPFAWMLPIALFFTFLILCLHFPVHAEPQDNLILYYDFNLQNDSSTIISDVSGSQNSGELKSINGKLDGMYAIEEANLYGKTVKALHLTGGQTGAYLQFPNGILYGNNAITISVWVKLPTNNGYQRIWDFGTGQDKYMYLLSDGRNAGFQGYASAITTAGWTNEKGVQKRDNIAKGRWVLTTLVMDGSKMSLYENGIQIGSTVDTGIRLADLGVTGNNYLGYGQFSENPTTGWFAECRIYNRALSKQEIKAMYDVDDTGIVSADKDELDLGDISGITEDMELPSEGINGSAITWKSENSAISIQGGIAKVERPAQGKENVTGRLTATIRKGCAFEKKSFLVTVLSQYSDAQVVEHDVQALREAIGDLSAVAEDIILPLRGEWGSSIRWESSASAVSIQSGKAKVTRPKVGEDSAKGSLRAVLSYGEEQEETEIKMTVLPLRKSVTAKEVEKIQVETYVGNSPSLPAYVKASYPDGSIKKVKAIWPAQLNADKYSSPGTFTVEGSVVGEKVKAIAEVTVIEGEKAPIEKAAESFRLDSITLDKSSAADSILIRNQERVINYLKLLDSERMLYNFYQTYGQEEKLEGVEPLSGWENPKGLLRGHSTGNYLSALTLAYLITEDGEMKERLDGAVHTLHGLQQLSQGNPQQFKTQGVDQTLWSGDYTTWGEGYLGAYPPDPFALLEQYRPYGQIWAPYYTMGKLLEGLLDAYAYTENEEALECAKGLGRWAYRRLSGCDKEQLSTMWGIDTSGEYGNCNGAMARLYLYTGEREFLEGAGLFDNTNFFHWMSKNIDDLAGRMTAQHVSQVLGALEVYQASLASGNPEVEYYDIAKNFWNLAISRYMYSTGGMGTNDSFDVFPESYQLAKGISDQANCEICVACNMLELTRMLSQYEPENAAYMDYYERTLYNQILPSQNPASTVHYGISRWIPIHPGSRREYGGDYNSFTCCHSMGMKAHLGYQQAAYSKTGEALYVNLYLPSSVSWQEKGIKITQETEFPSETTKLSISALPEMEAQGIQLKLRVPYWATEGFAVKVNGKDVEEPAEAATYLTLEHIQFGDVIEIKMPWTAHLDKTPDYIGTSTVASVMYGPFVMAVRNNSRDWLTLVLPEDLKEAFQISNNPLHGYPQLEDKTGNIFVPIFAPEFATNAYHAYFKIITTIEQADQEGVWHEVRLQNLTPERGMFTLSAGMVRDGEEVSIISAPKEGYCLKSIIINEKKMPLKSGGTYTIKNVTEDIEISASFRPLKIPEPDPAHLEYRATAFSDYTASWEYLGGINTNWEPESSNEGRIGLGWGNYYQTPGSEHYVQYEWDTKVSMDQFEIYWYDDKSGTRVPGSLKVMYLDDKGEWKEAHLLTEYEDMVATDRYNVIRLDAITTTSVKLVMNVLDGAGATGIYRWKVSLEDPS